MYTRERLTYSLNGAAYAVAKGVKLIRTYREPGGKHTLVLDDGYDQAIEALREFWDGDPMINARTYVECRRYIIDEMNSLSHSTHKENENADSTATATAE